MREITITVVGSPAPQGSKRFVGHAKNGRGIMVESSAGLAPWRQDVKYSALKAIRGIRGFEMIRGAVAVSMVFTLRKPKHVPKGRSTFPDRQPDLSKLVRSTEDALTEAGVWEDDARIISCLSRKVYPGEGAGSLTTPGAVIVIASVLSQ